MVDRNTKIRSSQIGNDEVKPEDLQSTNSPSDNDIPSYDLSTGKFTWEAPSVSSVPASIEQNIILNAFRIAINGSLSVFNMVDGAVDEFEDETGIDTVDSLNETYDSAGDYYTPTGGGYTADQCTGGTPSASSAIDVHVASRAFDDSLTLWWMANATTGWIQYDFGSGNDKTITQYTINSGTMSATRMCKDWVLEASATGAWGGEEVLLDTITGETSWGASEERTFQFVNSTAYRYYRITISANNGDVNYAGMAEIEMMEDSAPTNITLIPEPTEAEVNPDEGRIIILEEDIDTITIDTDLKAWVSRDDGANWVQATLTDEGDYESGRRILTGSADISGQASDKTMRWKITSHNNKTFRLHGVALMWD